MSLSGHPDEDHEPGHIPAPDMEAPVARNPLRTILLAALLALAPLGAAMADPVVPTPSTEVDAAPIVRTEFEQLTTEMLVPDVQVNRNCSGTVIHSDRDEQSGDVVTLILTAKHCTDALNQPMDIVVPTYNAETRIVSEVLYKGTVAGRYALHDLAYIRLLDVDTILPTTTIAPEGTILYPGEPVWTVGHPMGLPRTITTGNFGSLESVDFINPGKFFDYYRSTPAIIGGNSGGALYHQNAEGGYEFIGVTSMGFSATSFLNYYVPLPVIRTYVDMVVQTEERRVAASG